MQWEAVLQPKEYTLWHWSITITIIHPLLLR
jgi:hypothetical protein